MGETKEIPAVGLPGRDDGAIGLLPPVGRAGPVARALGQIVTFGTVMVMVVSVSALTAPAYAQWTAMILSVLALWAGWLYWRALVGDGSVPGHILQLALAVPILVLLGHLLGGARINPVTGKFSLLADSDTTLLVQLLTLCLMVLLVQDVLSRVRQPRWLLTALGLAAAIGAVLRLHLVASVPAQAVAMAGYAGIGILLAPCWLPIGPMGRLDETSARRLLNAELIARATVGALLAALIVVANHASISAGILTCGLVGAAMLLSGVCLRRHRAALLSAGLILSAAGLAGALRLGAHLPLWVRLTRVVGLGQVGAPEPANVPGMKVLVVSAGWLGLGAVTAGMFAAIIWGLCLSRRASAGDQARCALWTAVAAISGGALLVGGGLAVPAAAAVAAVAWGLMPHVMAHHVRRFTGGMVTAAFLAVLIVLGLEQRLSGSPWIRPLLREGDAVMHFGTAFLFAAVLFWQMRSRRWWQALLAGLIAGSAAALGEVAQQYLSTRHGEWSDVFWDFAGAAAALAVIFLLFGLQRLERVLGVRARVPYEKYDPWRAY